MKFLNLITKIEFDNKNCIKIISYANKEGSNKDIGFWKIIKDICGVHANKVL